MSRKPLMSSSVTFDSSPTITELIFGAGIVAVSAW